jgi:membrane protein required for colicin V production
MTLLDCAILAVLVLSVLQGLREGLIVAVVSLVSWIAGLLVAERFWPVAVPLVRIFATAIWVIQLASFFLVALLTVVALTLIARVVRRALHSVGLGWVDRLLGGAFGFLRGALLVVIGFIIAAALLPSAAFARNSRFAPFFLSAARTASRGTPAQAAGRVFFGLQHWQQEVQQVWRSSN